MAICVRVRVERGAVSRAVFVRDAVAVVVQTVADLVGRHSRNRTALGAATRLQNPCAGSDTLTLSEKTLGARMVAQAVVRPAQIQANILGGLLPVVALAIVEARRASTNDGPDLRIGYDVDRRTAVGCVEGGDAFPRRQLAGTLVHWPAGNVRPRDHLDARTVVRARDIRACAVLERSFPLGKLRRRRDARAGRVLARADDHRQRKTRDQSKTALHAHLPFRAGVPAFFGGTTPHLKRAFAGSFTTPAWHA